MYSLFIITLIPFLMVNGFFQQFRQISNHILYSHDDYFGSEYDFEINAENDNLFKLNHVKQMVENIPTQIKHERIYITMRKHNFLNRLLSNLEMERTAILEELTLLGVNISTLDVDEP
jgi:hypothetical protein